ncbi:MAG: ATP-binding protein [Desulfobacteraceae bacterium]|nr:ATP-binding protein [Desulfobacteraceae bacterium]
MAAVELAFFGINSRPSTKWVQVLYKRLTKVQKKRQKELDKINDLMFGDPIDLAKCYVEPDCQDMNPADQFDEDFFASRSPVMTVINNFFQSKSLEINMLFILSDAGMGKTALMTMLKLMYMTSLWPKKYNCVLMKLGKKTVPEIRKLENKAGTVLLLDSLDEDPMAYGKAEDRILDILDASKHFFKVVITCRTQFLPKTEADPFRRPGILKIGGYVCSAKYLSFFDDLKIIEFYEKRLPKKWGFWTDQQKIDEARIVVKAMGMLRCRPMLLAYIEELMESPLLKENSSEYQIYDILMQSWLDREEAKGGVPASDMRDVCIMLAVYMQIRQIRSINEQELDSLVSAISKKFRAIKEIDIKGRSLLNRNSEGHYLFSHYSVQEFCVAKWLTEGKPVFNPPEGQIHMTDFIAKMIDQSKKELKLPEVVDSEILQMSKNFFFKSGFIKMKDISATFLLLFKENQSGGFFLNIWDDRDDFSNIIDKIKKYKKKEDNNLVYLIYLKDKPSINLLHKFREEQCEIIPIAFLKIKKILSQDKSEPASELKKMEDPYLTKIDPYAESKPINDPTWFYGRDDIMRYLPPLLAQDQHVGVFGLRKVGKTSLVKQLQQRFISTPTAFIDCQSFNKSETYFKEIYKQIHSEMDSLKIKHLPKLELPDDSDEFFQKIVSLFRTWNKNGENEPFIIIFDEIDKLFPNPNVRTNEKLLKEYIALFKVLRGLAQSYQCLAMLVIAYRPDVNRQNNISSEIGENPMFHSFKETYLGFLDEKDSTRMIIEIGNWKDIHWESKTAEKVFYFCGGHPLITRYFASEACKGGSYKNIDLVRVNETAKDIEKNFSKNEIGGYYSRGVWEELEPDEQELLRMLAKAGNIQRDEITKSAIPQYSEDALANIEHFGLVTNSDGRLRITANLFTAWIKRKFGI